LRAADIAWPLLAADPGKIHEPVACASNSATRGPCIRPTSSHWAPSNVSATRTSSPESVALAIQVSVHKYLASIKKDRESTQQETGHKKSGAWGRRANSSGAPAAKEFGVSRSHSLHGAGVSAAAGAYGVLQPPDIIRVSPARSTHNVRVPMSWVMMIVGGRYWGFGSPASHSPQ
jgi:hypothetical protein